MQGLCVRLKNWQCFPFGNGLEWKWDLLSSVLSGENINICWSPDGQTIAVGNKDDVVTFIDAKTHRSKAEEQFKFEVNEISWNNDNNMFFLTNGNGCINILRQVPLAAGGLGWLQYLQVPLLLLGKLSSISQQSPALWWE